MRQTCASVDDLVHQPRVEIQDIVQCHQFGIQDPLDYTLKQSIRTQDPQDPLKK